MSFSFEVNLKNIFYNGKGKFDCHGIKINSLKGFPKEINGSFNCSRNQLTSLQDCPEIVQGIFLCHHNKLTSLEGGPKVVKKRFDCSHNKLTSLKGSPEEINSCFDCSENDLTTLEGSPKVVNGDFKCQCNNLTSLEGCPKKIKGTVVLNFNKSLKDISDLPEEVEKLYLCCCNDIEVFPKHIKDTLLLMYTPEKVYERLKQQPHLEIVKDNSYRGEILIREKSLGNQLLGAI